MTAGLTGLGRATLVAVVAAAIGSVVVGVRSPAPAAAASTGLTTTADTRYVVDPAKHRIHVTVDLAATNHRTDTKTHRFFFDQAYLSVPAGTAGFRIASAGAKPKVAVTSRHSTYSLLRIDFGSQLAAGATRTFQLTFDIPDPGGAATRATRIGTSLVTFTAWGLGSDGATGGSVTVVFPKGYTVAGKVGGFTGPSSDAAGDVVYATGRLANALTFQATFAADRPSDYRETTLQVPMGASMVPVTLRAWPDDAAWAKKVGDLLKRGIPALAQAIGVPWTAAGPIVVQEAISRNAGDPAGQYDPSTGTIEISWTADPYVVLHQAALAWFDGGLVADRWANEGFSTWYALQAASAIGVKVPAGRALTPALDAVRIPLNAWAGPSPDAPPTQIDAAEKAVALKLAGLTAERAGPGGLRAVWQAIHDRRATDQAAGGLDPEQADGVPDWRGFLDLLEDRTGSSYADLWTTWVLRPADAALLAQRGAARDRYAAVTAHAGNWQLPSVIRDSLGVWQFGQAGQLLDAAAQALDDRDAVTTAASAAGLDVPDTMQTDFEGPRGFAAASAEAGAELAAIGTYTDAAATRPAQPDLFQAVGLWNAPADDALAHAASAFAAGDLATSVQDSGFARMTWETASVVGRNRILGVAASLAAILLGLALSIRWYRDRVVRQRWLLIDR